MMFFRMGEIVQLPQVNKTSTSTKMQDFKPDSMSSQQTWPLALYLQLTVIRKIMTCSGHCVQSVSDVTLSVLSINGSKESTFRIIIILALSRRQYTIDGHIIPLPPAHGQLP